jgi:hypothetical protein
MVRIIEIFFRRRILGVIILKRTVDMRKAIEPEFFMYAQLTGIVKIQCHRFIVGVLIHKFYNGWLRNRRQAYQAVLAVIGQVVYNLCSDCR